MTDPFTHLPPNNPEAIRELLDRHQQTTNKLRKERRLLAKENQDLRNRILDLDPDACLPCHRCGNCETHDCGGCLTREELLAIGHSDEELDDHFGTEPSLADAIGRSLSVSSAEVRRTMYAGGVLYDGEQVRDPVEPVKPYLGKVVFYGKDSTPVRIPKDGLDA